MCELYFSMIVLAKFLNLPSEVVFLIIGLKYQFKTKVTSLPKLTTSTFCTSTSMISLVKVTSASKQGILEVGYE